MNFSHLGWCCLLQKSKTTQQKYPVPDIRSLLLSCWPGLPKRLPKNIQSIAFALGSPEEVEGKSLFLKISCTSLSGPRDPWTRTDLHAPSVSNSFHDIRCHNANFQMREATGNPAQPLWITSINSKAQKSYRISNGTRTLMVTTSL